MIGCSDVQERKRSKKVSPEEPTDAVKIER
jgi:hypothetical protein